MKRAFVREFGCIVDVVVGPDGAKCRLERPAAVIDEEPTTELKEELFSRIADGEVGSAMLGDRSPRYLEAALAGLRNGSIEAPMVLTGFLEDPRVQPALVEATRTAYPRSLGNIAQALGIVGGPGSRAILRERL